METIDEIEGDESYLDLLGILLGPDNSLTNRYFSSIFFLIISFFYFVNFKFLCKAFFITKFYEGALGFAFFF
jgi:hypothetical protein